MRKNKGSIRELLGVNQEDMAALLKISRAQWSMFESGKRSLPPEADKQFAALLNHVKSAKQDKNKQRPEAVQINEETPKKLKSSLSANQHRQRLTVKKINRLQKKQEMGTEALYLEGFFESHKEGQPEYLEGYIESILKRAIKDVQLAGSPEMIELQIKLNMLGYEEKLIKAALEDYPNTSPS